MPAREKVPGRAARGPCVAFSGLGPAHTPGDSPVLCLYPRTALVRTDSALEGSGFELLVPLRKRCSYGGRGQQKLPEAQGEFRPKNKSGAAQPSGPRERKRASEGPDPSERCARSAAFRFAELIALVAVSRRTSRCSPAAGKKPPRFSAHLATRRFPGLAAPHPRDPASSGRCDRE
jgi:hypothetical protein